MHNPTFGGVLGRRFFRSLVIACACGLCAASIDASSGFIAAGSRFQSLAFSAAGVGLVALLALVGFLVVRWLIVAPLARRSTDDHALSVAVAMGLAAFAAAYDADAPHTGVSGLYHVLVNGALGAAVGVGAHALAVIDGRREAMTPSRLVGRALPFALPLALVAAWIGFVRVDDVTSVRFALVVAGLAVAVVGVGLGAAAVSRRLWPWGVLGLYGVVLLVGVAGTVGIGRYGSLHAGVAKRKHGGAQQVIMLTVDTLRRDSVSCYGSTTVSTPNIDRIAADGCLFRNVTSSSSWTLPAFASMMTGLTARGHGVVMSTAALPDTVVTLAERFRDAGYATHALVANGILAPHLGFARGFARYHLRQLPARPVCIGESLAARLKHEPLAEATSTRDVTNAAIAWARARKDQDFFLWVHYLDPHLPYTPPEVYVHRMNVHDQMGLSIDITSAMRPSMELFGDPSRRVWARSLYDAEVRYVDAEIGRFLAVLKESGIYDRALIVFAVDHGEEFWDHDGFEHGHTLYQEVVSVPLIVKPPGEYERRVVEDPVAIYDVAPTVLDICGLPPLDTPQAVSLSGFVAGRPPRVGTRPIFSGGTLFRSNFESVVFDGWKYIRSATTGRDWLFRLSDDPTERLSLIHEHPDLVARGRRLIDDYLHETEAFRARRGISNPSIKLDAEEIERLRALGYL
jgi:arylsulfatase A-like enzyme